MGTALTYARRYMLFTLVGIAGEDDLDAPDLNGALLHPDGSDARGQHAAPGIGPALPSDFANPAASIPTPTPTATSDYGRRKQVRSPRVLLSPDHSLALRENLISELKGFIDSDALTIWAQRILGLKNQLTTSDAQEVEAAFAAKLDELGNDGKAPFDPPETIARVAVGRDSKPATADGNTNFDGEPIPTSEKQNTHTSSMAIACQSESQPAEMHQLPAQLPSLPRSPSPHLARSFGCEIEIISSSWAPSLAWPAAVARRTRIILSSRSSGRLVAKLVMSLPYHCAVLTIANSISAATNAYGGNNSTSIRCQ